VSLVLVTRDRIGVCWSIEFRRLKTV